MLKKGDKIIAASSGKKYEVHTIGIMSPHPLAKDTLYAGQVGYVTLGMKNAKEARVGDTFFHEKHPTDILPGFKPAKSMVFAGLFPGDPNEYEKLQDSIEKLVLNDSSVSIQKETRFVQRPVSQKLKKKKRPIVNSTVVKFYSAALGQGWRIGFLGMLHMDVFRQRLEEVSFSLRLLLFFFRHCCPPPLCIVLCQEYGASVIVTAPTVTYKVETRAGEEIIVQTPAKFPEPGVVKEAFEPIVSGTIIIPKEFVGEIMTLCQNRRGVQKEMTFLGESRVLLKYELPLAEIVVDFYDELKSITAGYASFDYEESAMQKTKITKVLLPCQPLRWSSHGFLFCFVFLLWLVGNHPE